MAEENNQTPNPATATPGLTKAETAALITEQLGSFEGSLLTKLTALFPQPAAPASTPTTPTPAPGTTQQTAVDNTAMDALKKHNQEMAKRLSTMEDANKASEQKLKETSKRSAIDNVLGQFDFHNAAAKGDAMSAILPLIVEGADGGWVSNDARTVEAIIGEVLSGPKSYLLKPEPTQGSGNGRGNAGSVMPGGAMVSMEDIKPGASNEVLAAAARAIRRVMPRQ